MNMMPPAERLAPEASASKHRRIADIEMLRGLAVLLVLFEHLQFNLVYWHSVALFAVDSYLRGWVGVDLFFAISGFVIARTLLPDIRGCGTSLDFHRVAIRFWIRRAWRLLPSAWLWLLVPLLLCLVFNRSGAFQTFRANWEGSLAALLDVANFRIGQIYGTRPAGLEFPYWSLSLEEQFYILLPVLAFVCRRFLPHLLLLVVAWQFVRGETVAAMMTRGAAISLGVLLAIWAGHPSWKLWEPKKLGHSFVVRGIFLVTMLLCLTGLGAEGSTIVWFRVGMIALLSAVLVWVASYDGDYLLHDGALRRVLLWIGSRSYGIYVIHASAYAFMHELWVRIRIADHPVGLQAAAYVGAGVLLVFGLAELNHLLVETPLRRRGILISNSFGHGTVVHH